MFRKIVLLIVFAFAAGFVGCRSCWAPYDQCQPTFVPEAGDQCMGELYRNGSILGGMCRRGSCGCGSCGDSSCSDCAGTEQAPTYEPETGTNSYEGYPNDNAENNINNNANGAAEQIPIPNLPEARPNGPQEPLPIEEFLPDGAQNGYPLNSGAINM